MRINQNDVQLQDEICATFFNLYILAKALAFAKFLSDRWFMNKPHYLVFYVTLSIGFLGCQKDVETVKEHIDKAEKPIQAPKP